MISVAIAEYRRKLRRLRKWHLGLCLLGMIMSAYSIYVEINLEKDPNYRALCDISPGISCTAVFGSEWGKGFGFIGKLVGENSTLNQPNGVFGVISYPIFTLTSRFEYMFLAKASLLIGIMGLLISGYLAYILLYILEDMCVICIATYIINILLLIITIIYYRNMKNLIAEQSNHMDMNAPKIVSKKRV